MNFTYNIVKSHTEYTFDKKGIFRLYRTDTNPYEHYKREFLAGDKIFITSIINKHSGKLDFVYVTINECLDDIVEPMTYYASCAKAKIQIDNETQNIFQAIFEHETLFFYISENSLLLSKKALPEW